MSVTHQREDNMGLNFDDDDDEAPILVDSSDTPQVGVIGKVPITIVTGYLGAGSMSGFPTKISYLGY